MRHYKSGILFIFAAALAISALTGCATTKYSYTYTEALYEQKVEKGSVLRHLAIDRLTEDKILAMDPEHITERDIKELLLLAPAPRIINLHGGIHPVYLAMESFSRFLISMGYPESKVRNPRDGSYSYSCYENSERLAGLIAWYYEKEGMRPMIIGHSQGGIQAVKVLHELAGSFSKKINVWNPLEWKSEQRHSVIDPLTGSEQPVVGLKASYVSAAAAGGLTRILPNQWSMSGRLRIIPDTAVEFTGFYLDMDLLGSDLISFGAANNYRAAGKAKVRNIRLPSWYKHGKIPFTDHLSKTPEIKDLIDNYVPSEKPETTPAFNYPAVNLLWAADVWHSIKKHWCLEIQRMIKAKRAVQNES